MAIAGLILGCCSLGFSLILGWVSFVNILWLLLGIAGLILSILGGKQLKANGQPAGVATAGLIISIIGTVFALIDVATCTICACAVAASAPSYDFYY